MGEIKITLGSPQPKQIEFLEATQRYVCFGGARSGGKSWAVRFKALLMALSYPGIKQMIIRRSYVELTENHINPLRLETVGYAVYKDKDKSLCFPNGSRIKFSYCSNDGDTLQYNGQEWDIVYLDEAQQLKEEWFNAIKATNRGVNSFPHRIYITCNPGGVGMQWIRRLFIERDFNPEENPDDYVFIQSLVTDNQALMEADPDYIKKLESLPPAQRAAWRYGDWYSYEGRFFSEFRPKIHVVPYIEIQPHWRRYRAIDYGLDMCAVLWIAVDETGQEYIYRELHEPNLIAGDAAKKIVEMTGDEKIEATFAPPDLWSRTKDTGKNVAELFAESGVRFTKCNAERISGWLCVKEHIKPIVGMDGEETSRLRVFEGCRVLIKNLQLLEFSESRPGDAATDPHEITHICVSGDTMICTPSGEKPISSLVGTSGECYCWDEKRNIVVKPFDYAMMTQESADVFEVELDDGTKIKATANHKVLTVAGWKEIKELSSEDEILQFSSVDQVPCRTRQNRFLSGCSDLLKKSFRSIRRFVRCCLLRSDI